MPDGVSAIRALAAIPVALLAAACWTPGPRPLERQFYRWEAPERRTAYCIMSLELPSASGITVTPGGGNTMDLKCNPPAEPKYKPER